MPNVITLGGSASTGSGYTFGDLIEKVYRRVAAGVSETTIQLATPGTLDTTTVTFAVTGPQVNQCAVPGALLAVDMEIMLVLSYQAPNITVERGYLGSTAGTHATGSLMYRNPRISRYDIGVAINDDLNDLSSHGLYRVGTATITYNPVFEGYDLGDLPSNFLEILELRYQLPVPNKNYPAITRWKVNRYQNLSDFPSGNALLLYEGAYPGLPINVTYSAPFIPFVDLSDNICDTPTTNDPAPPYNGYTASSVPNLPPTAVDIPPLGAAVDLISSQEPARSNFAIQPDPRKAQDVPPLAIMNSTQYLEKKRMQRIEAEALKLRLQYTKSPHR